VLTPRCEEELSKLNIAYEPIPDVTIDRVSGIVHARREGDVH